jgi:hypothetical protein
MMNPLHFPSVSLVTVAVSIAAATVPASLDHRTVREADRGHPPSALDCRLDGAPGHATRLLLTNVGILPLPGGTRYAWATLGTPAPQGEMRVLEHTLERGASVAVVAAPPAHGSGCIAVQAG